MADNNGNIVKRSTQYIDNLGFNEDTQLKSVEIGGTDGATVNRLKINSDGSINASIASSLAPVAHDEIVLTYVPSGDGVGEIATVVYKLATATVATLTLTYNSSNKLTGVVRT